MEQVDLPIRTKIAAWWMVTAGLVFAVVSFWVNADWAIKYLSLGYYSSFSTFFNTLFSLSVPSFISLIFLFLPGVILLLRKKWAVKYAVVSLLFGGLFEAIDVIWAFSEDLIYWDLNRFSSGVLLLPLLLIPFLLLYEKGEPNSIKSSK
jgi:hypothetical protein